MRCLLIWQQSNLQNDRIIFCPVSAQPGLPQRRRRDPSHPAVLRPPNGLHEHHPWLGGENAWFHRAPKMRPGAAVWFSVPGAFRLALGVQVTFILQLLRLSSLLFSLTSLQSSVNHKLKLIAYDASHVQFFHPDPTWWRTSLFSAAASSCTGCSACERSESGLTRSQNSPQASRACALTSRCSPAWLLSL